MTAGVAAVTLALGLTPLATGTASASAPRTTTPTAKILWGDVAINWHQVFDFNTTVGRYPGLVRVYKQWDENMNYNETWERQHGITLLLSVRADTVAKQVIKWRDIANAKPGSVIYNNIVRWAQQIKAFGAPIYVAFNHEPEAVGSWANGNASDYVAAYRQWVNIFRAQKATNAKFAFVTTARGYTRKDAHNSKNYYPGDAYVDAIGGDGYNWYGCMKGSPLTWASFQSIIDPVRKFGLLHPTKPLLVAEWGSHEDPKDPNRKAQWISDVAALFKTPAYHQFIGMTSYSGTNNNPGCKDFTFDSSPQALKAFTAMGADAYYQAGM
jgi:hypothetical protein